MLRINGLPVVSLETLTPSILPKADFTASSNILSAALKQQRACIVDIGAELATVLSQALPDDEVLYNHAEGAIEHISKREKEILRFSASPDATETFTMQVHRASAWCQRFSSPQGMTEALVNSQQLSSA